MEQAQSLFNASENKNLPMYGAMMKGKDYFYSYQIHYESIF